MKQHTTLADFGTIIGKLCVNYIPQCFLKEQNDNIIIKIKLQFKDSRAKYCINILWESEIKLFPSNFIGVGNSFCTSPPHIDRYCELSPVHIDIVS